jgi:hypothetical protein
MSSFVLVRRLRSEAFRIVAQLTQLIFRGAQQLSPRFLRCHVGHHLN